MITNACEGVPPIASPAQKRLKSIEEEEESTFAIYPNPTSGDLFVNYELKEGEMAELILFDIAGRRVFRQALNSGSQHQFNLAKLQHGVYVYRLIEDETIKEHGKLVFQK